MDTNSDDSAAARENPEETVWPPPPTGPRVVAVRPSPRLPNEFRVPKWTKSAGNCLGIALVASWIDVDSPIFVRFLVGGLLILDSLLISSFLGGAGRVAYARAASAIKGQGYLPTKADGKYFTLNSWLGISTHLMFFVWALSVVFSSHSHLITSMALAFWIVMLVAGLGVAAVNGVKYWLLSRHESGRHSGR